MNNQSKPAEEYPEGSVSLATSAAEPEADVCAICHDFNGLNLTTHCCKQPIHWACLFKWVHGDEDTEAHHNCPLCREGMDLSGDDYNALDELDSPYFRQNPHRYVWNKEDMEWNYTGPFPDFTTCLLYDKENLSIIPEEVRNGQTDAEFVINWNRRGEQPNGDLRTWTMNPCQCSRRCYRGAYVLALWHNGEFDPQVLLNRCDFVLHRGKYVHKDCYERDNKHYELAKTLTDNFKLDTCFDDKKLDDKTRLSTFLHIRKPEGVRHFKKECCHCNRKVVFLHKDKEGYEVLSGNGWQRIRYDGNHACNDCMKHYNHCDHCESYFRKDFSFAPECQNLCYPCGEAKTTVYSFVNSRGGFQDGNRLDIYAQVRCYAYDNRKGDAFVNKLIAFCPKEWVFHHCVDYVVLCKRENSKFIRAIVTLQRAYRKKAWKFVRTFSRNFTPGTYPANFPKSFESIELRTPPGFNWRVLQCQCDPCVGWRDEEDDAFHSRTDYVLSERTKSAMKTAGWRHLAGDEVCPDCYAKKRELARTFTHDFWEDYIDINKLPEGLDLEELEEIVKDAGFNITHVDCDDCYTRDYCVTIENCPDFFWNNGWKLTDKNLRDLCPTCSENYVTCGRCDDDEVQADESKCLWINEEVLEVCADCYETTIKAYAVTIQRHVRGFLIRQKALRDSAAVSIQRICRGHIARKRMKKLKEAIVEYVRKESGGTMVLKEGTHKLLWRRDLDVLMEIGRTGILGRAWGRSFQPYLSPETKSFGCLRCHICSKSELYTTSDEVGYTGSQFGWEDIDFTVGMRSVCPTCIKARFSACRGCSKSYYPKDLIDGRCLLCLKAEAAGASKRIQRGFRSYAKRKLYIAVRDAYVACCTFTDKFKPGLYRDDHCLSSFLKLMPSVEYLKKYDYVACSCDDRSCLTDWIYIFDKTSPNYVPINRKGEWQCQKCLPTTTGSKKRAAMDQSEGQTSKRAKQCSHTKTMQIFVKTVSGRTLTVDVEPSLTVSGLKRVLERRPRTVISGDWVNARLIFAGHVLEDDKTLQHYNINKEATIHETGYFGARREYSIEKQAWVRV